ncbi:MAG: NAD-dependent protein deacylase [Nitrospinota bacterium]|nr:MAG: NAD-dependent protein deacylase [Nitrospinota bacterium]
MKNLSQTELERAADLLIAARYVTALTGAGVSVESGIPPFRGPDGLWTKHGEPPLDGYQRFLADPKGYWENRLHNPSPIAVALEKAKPNPGHYAMVELEELGILRMVITQNIDNLHRMAGQKRLAEIHGNGTLLRCIQCGTRFARTAISLEVLPPRCPHCQGLIKSDTVSFGEPIPLDVLEVCERETRRSDCMLVAGTSAFVYPAAAFPQQVKQQGGILIEVNLTETPLTPWADVSLQGKFGEILPALCACVKARLQGRTTTT